MRRAKLRPREGGEGQEMAAVVMVMEEGKEHGGGFALDERGGGFALEERGGGFALDERAPPCHIFPRTKMPLD